MPTETEQERRRRISPFAYWALWTGLAVLFASQSIILYAYVDQKRSGVMVPPGAPKRWALTLVTSLADWYIWAALAPAIVWLGRRVPIGGVGGGGRDGGGGVLRGLLAHLALGSAVATAKIAFRSWVGAHVSWLPAQAWPISLVTFPLNLLTYGAILGASYAYEYYERFRERELRAAALESRLARAELEVLRMQLHPHFLFNTLHAISVLVRERETDAADRMLTRLSDLLRMSLDNAARGAQEVPLARELEFLDGYLDIQKTRFGERLRVRVDAEPAALGALVPSLVLQPLVENAVRHAIAPRPEGGRLDVAASVRDGVLTLEVRDDGPGLAAGTAAFERGVGLSNTRARLAQLYGARGGIAFRDAPGGGLVVAVTVPQ